MIKDALFEILVLCLDWDQIHVHISDTQRDRGTISGIQCTHATNIYTIIMKFMKKAQYSGRYYLNSGIITRIPFPSHGFTIELHKYVI